MNHLFLRHRKQLPTTMAGLVLSAWCIAGACQPTGYLTRQEVRAQTIAAVRDHQLVPAGEGGYFPDPPRTPSGKTGAQRRAETLAARNAGTLVPAGEAEAWRPDRELASRQYDRTRQQVRAETVQAVRDHKLIPAGEGTLAD
jgi:hypothetical protein